MTASDPTAAKWSLTEAVTRDNVQVTALKHTQIMRTPAACIIMHMRTVNFMRSIVNQLVTENLRALRLMIIRTDGSSNNCWATSIASDA